MTVYRAKESFAFTDKDGVPRVIVAGTPIADSDPEYLIRKHLFEPLELAYGSVEEATAAPGIFRRRGRPPKATSAAEPEAEGTVAATVVATVAEPEPEPKAEPKIAPKEAKK